MEEEEGFSDLETDIDAVLEGEEGVSLEVLAEIGGLGVVAVDETDGLFGVDRGGERLDDVVVGDGQETNDLLSKGADVGSFKVHDLDLNRLSVVASFPSLAVVTFADNLCPLFDRSVGHHRGPQDPQPRLVLSSQRLYLTIFFFFFFFFRCCCEFECLKGGRSEKEEKYQ